VANQGAVRLLKALEEVKPANDADFFGFAALQVRRVLLDLARKSGCAEAGCQPEFEGADGPYVPAKLAACTEFQTAVDNLPEGTTRKNGRAQKTRSGRLVLAPPSSRHLEWGWRTTPGMVVGTLRHK
jgi:hypothetical protein